ncbi:MAG: RNA polymerase factor sigma-54 [Chloroherpetonaceae bacterium]|nr:RNA polymerase factor sigma-54 [Chloroherpetonaceae bacterium]
MGLNLSQQQTQTLRLSPQQILYTKLLQLPLLQLEARMKEELDINPMLELESETDEESNSLPTLEPSPDVPLSSIETINAEVESLDLKQKEKPAERDEPDPNPTEKALQSEDREVDIPDYGVDDDSYSPPTSSSSRNEDFEFQQPTPKDFFASLEEQISFLDLSEKEVEIAKEMIGNLEDDGYLRCLFTDIQEGLFNRGILIIEEEYLKVLKQLQSLEPAGIAARSLQECLLIQLERLIGEDDGEHESELELARLILQKHYDDFSSMRYPKLVQSLSVSTQEIKKALDLIKRLNPKPASFESGDTTGYVQPDFQVYYDGTSLQLFTNDRALPAIRLSSKYKDILNDKSQSKEAKDWVKQKADSAKAFITAIEMRRYTMQRVLEALMKRQHDFFIEGPSKLRPMILKDIADETGLDISTISRVVNGKYVRTDFGVFELRSFFTTAVETESGDEISNRIIKQTIKDFIEKEESGKPLSDDKLADLLNSRGYKLARRTVAKYREEMNIPVARLRKKFDAEPREDSEIIS